MRLVAASMMLVLAFAPVPCFAHGDRPPAAHGGDVQEAAEIWLELVVKGIDVRVYVLDQAHKPVLASGISGSATVLIDGKSYKVELNPAEGNSLRGTLPIAATARIVATVTLKVGGKPASARFVGVT